MSESLGANQARSLLRRSVHQRQRPLHHDIDPLRPKRTRVTPRLKRFHHLGHVLVEALQPEEHKELSNAALIAAADILDCGGQLGPELLVAPPGAATACDRR